MTSALNTKINSYSIQVGLEFDYAYSLTPTMTGSLASTINNTGWVLQGFAPTYESTVGPAGGSGSWRFKSGPTIGGDGRFRSTNSTWMQSINDKDYSVGFWVKLNSTVPSGFALPIQTWQPSTTNGYLLTAYNNGTSTKFEMIGSQTITSSNPIVLNTWYYLAIVRTPTSFTFYINGISQGSYAFSGTGPNGTNINFGQVNQGFDADFNLSNWYEAPTSVIGATQIADIYDAGAFSKVVKYYDGSAWQTASGQKVYNGTSWMNLTNANTKKWDGSAWVKL